MKRLVIILMTQILFMGTIFSEVVGKVNYKGKQYHVDVITNKTHAEIWFRLKSNASSIEDILITKLSAETSNRKYYLDLACRAKEYTDGTKTIVGCMSVVGSVFCAMATVETAGGTAFVCTGTWEYAIESGAADCLEGVSEAIAKKLGKENEWKALAMIVGLNEPSMLKAIDKAIDYMCDDVKQKK